MYSFDDIIEYDQFLEEHDFIEAESFLKEPKWTFKNFSSFNYPHKIFWMMELDAEPFFTEKIFQKVKQCVGEHYELKRVYANGQTYGLDGAPHPDVLEDNYYTFIIYMNRQWDLLWGGDTVFLNRYFDVAAGEEKLFDGDVMNKTKKITPTPNKAVFFPGAIVHYAQSPSRDYFGLRMTIAYKLYRKGEL